MKAGSKPHFRHLLLICGCFVMLFVAKTALCNPSLSPSNPPDSVSEGAVLEKILQDFSQKTGIDLICDAQPGDTFLLYPSHWSSLQPREALAAIAKDSGREIVVIDGIHVLRSRSWAQTYLRTYSDSPDGRTSQPPSWSDSGFITTERLDAAGDVTDQPAQRVNVTARHVSCTLIAAQLNKKAGCRITIEQELKPRRVHVFVKDISPSALMGGIAYLINGGPEIVLRQSEAQKKTEKYAQFDDMPDLKKRIIQSDKLRDKVEKLLTQEQREALSKGESVEISLATLPENLRQQAIDYINMVADMDAKLILPPDLSKRDNFAVRFHPKGRAIAWFMLGVKTIAQNGTEYYY